MSESRWLLSTVMLAMLNGGVALAVSRTQGVEYVNPKLANGEVQIHNVCMMPAEAKLSKVGMKGQEGMSKESDDWSSALQAVAESHLKASGLQVLPSGMSQEELEKNDELRQVVLKLEEKYDSISGQLDKHPKDTRKARFTVGDEVSLLPCTAHADTLVYVHGQGQVLTGGKKVFGALIAGPSASTAYMRLSLVDAKSGEILAYIRLLNGEKFVNDSEKAYGKTLDKQFKKMKLGNTAEKKKKN